MIALVRPTSHTAHLTSPGVRLSAGDLSDVNSLALGMAGCEAVVHIASPKGGWKRPEIYQTLLINGTRNVVAAMHQCGVRRLIYLSTISVHGLDPVQGQPVGERNGWGTHFLPYDYYGRAKVEAEQLVQTAHHSGVIQVTVLRPGWLYGPEDEASYGRLADWMRRGWAIRIGAGHNRIPLVYVENAVDLIWRNLVQRPSDGGTFIYAYDGLTTQNDYLASLRRATGVTHPPLYVPKTILLFGTTLLENLSVVSRYRLRAVLTRYYIHLMGSDWHFDQSHVTTTLGFKPQIDYTEGYRLTEAWYRKSRSL